MWVWSMSFWGAAERTVAPTILTTIGSILNCWTGAKIEQERAGMFCLRLLNALCATCATLHLLWFFSVLSPVIVRCVIRSPHSHRCVTLRLKRNRFVQLVELLFFFLIHAFEYFSDLFQTCSSYVALNKRFCFALCRRVISLRISWDNSSLNPRCRARARCVNTWYNNKAPRNNTRRWMDTSPSKVCCCQKWQKSNKNKKICANSSRVEKLRALARPHEGGRHVCVVVLEPLCPGG